MTSCWSVRHLEVVAPVGASSDGSSWVEKGFREGLLSDESRFSLQQVNCLLHICFMGGCFMGDLDPSPWQALSGVRFSESHLKINVWWTLKVDLPYLFIYHAMLLNFNCWSSMHSWLRNWKADLLGPFHPEALSKWWFIFPWFLTICPLQGFFFPTQVYTTIQTFYLWLKWKGSEWIVLYTHPTFPSSKLWLWVALIFCSVPWTIIYHWYLLLNL